MENHLEYWKQLELSSGLSVDTTLAVAGPVGWTFSISNTITTFFSGCGFKYTAGT